MPYVSNCLSLSHHNMPFAQILLGSIQASFSLSPLVQQYSYIGVFTDSIISPTESFTLSVTPKEDCSDFDHYTCGILLVPVAYGAADYYDLSVCMRYQYCSETISDAIIATSRVSSCELRQLANDWITCKARE